MIKEKLQRQANLREIGYKRVQTLDKERREVAHYLEELLSDVDWDLSEGFWKSEHSAEGRLIIRWPMDDNKWCETTLHLTVYPYDTKSIDPDRYGMAYGSEDVPTGINSVFQVLREHGFELYKTWIHEDDASEMRGDIPSILRIVACRSMEYSRLILEWTSLEHSANSHGEHTNASLIQKRLTQMESHIGVLKYSIEGIQRDMDNLKKRLGERRNNQQA